MDVTVTVTEEDRVAAQQTAHSHRHSRQNWERE
jgi:hypothetical protein